MNNYTCNHCIRTFDSNRALASHVIYCEKNPERKQKTEKWYAAMANKNPNNGWTNFDWSSVPFEKLGRDKKRKLLLEEANYCCTQCGFNKTRECGGSILEIDHIDGDHSNNSHENLRVLCPNCHALTPNYRNWGRNSKEKSSTRIRKGNSNYNTFLEEKKSSKEIFENEFIELITKLHETGEIDFKVLGWIQKLSDITKEVPHVSSRRIKRLMPDFYEQNCFKKESMYKSKLSNLSK